MIFQLQCTIEELTGACRVELQDVFSNLINADRSGKHFFVLQRKLCKWATENLELSGNDFSHLELIREQYTVRGGLLNIACVYVKVTIGDGPVTYDRKNTFSIGHQRLLEGKDLLNKSCLIVEDFESDGQLYNCIFKMMTKTTNVPSIELQLEHGGGSKIHRVFKSKIEEPRIAVCIVDHDKLAPMDKVSKTAKEVDKIYTNRNININTDNQRFIGLGISTIGRELENHIPYHILKKTNTSYPDFDKLDELVSQVGCVSPENCFWQYFDIKNGFNGSKLKTKLKNSVDVRNWICEKVGCEYETIERIHISGFGDRVVKTFLENPEALGDFHKFVRSHYWQSMFGAYFEELLWYFAAPEYARS